VNLILFGPPGAGKGTQSNNLVNLYNLHKVSTGDLLRNEIKNNTDLGNKIKHLINKGKFVSDKIINKLIENILSDKNFFNRLIFDGYPRNLNQAKELDLLLKKYNQKITCVLNLKVDKKIIFKRILGRQICNKCGLIFNKYFNPSTRKNHNCDTKLLTKRSDDTAKTIGNRYKTYVEKTLPIINYYEKQKLLHYIDGMSDIDQIFVEIRGIISSLET